MVASDKGVEASAAKNAIISATQYDNAGRVMRSYLPFTGTTLPYAENVFDNSPINEVTEQSAPGETWSIAQGHTKRLALKTNGQAVPKWIVNSDSSCSVSGSYTAGSLFLTEVTDENNNITKEYRDK